MLDINECKIYSGWCFQVGNNVKENKEDVEIVLKDVLENEEDSVEPIVNLIIEQNSAEWFYQNQSGKERPEVPIFINNFNNISICIDDFLHNEKDFIDL